MLRNIGRPGLGAGSAVVAFAAVLCGSPASALTPKSPEVKAAVQKALGYLSNNIDRRMGGQVLIGLTFLKAEQPNHPKVAEGIKAANDILGRLSVESDVYNLGVLLIFLTELPKEIQPQY